MEKISNRVNSLAESQTLEMSQKSRDLQAKGIDVINLSDLISSAWQSFYVFEKPIDGSPEKSIHELEGQQSDYNKFSCRPAIEICHFGTPLFQQHQNLK